MNNMTYEQALAYTHSFEKFGWVLGLERMRKLMERLGNPQDRLRFIHIAGTNGKGSTTAMCTQVLQTAGYRCGMYTSPFVVDFRERFQINGEMIAKDEFAAYAERIRSEVEALKEQQVQITEFEAITALAFLWFYEQKCDIVCLEVGLGGNYDATNIINTPLVSAVLSISLDHVNILGDTVEKIAGEKAGIIKQDGICVCYPKQNPKAVAVLMERCANQNAQFIQPNPKAVEILESSIDANRFIYDGIEYTMQLAGEYQIFNALTVIEVMKQLRLQRFSVPEDCVRDGIARTYFPARFERLSRQPLVIADGAHNLEGVTVLAQTLATVRGGRKVALIGMLGDKDYEHALAKLAAQVDEMICVPVDNPRALDCEVLAACAERFCGKVSAERDYRAAFHQAYDQLNPEDLLIACGSFYMVGVMREVILEELKNSGKTVENQQI